MVTVPPFGRNSGPKYNVHLKILNISSGPALRDHVVSLVLTNWGSERAAVCLKLSVHGTVLRTE